MPAFVQTSPRSLSARLRSESGIALPAAIVLLFVVMTLADAAVAAASSGNDQSRRDRSVKRALAAADAGLQAALYRYNKVRTRPTSASPWVRAAPLAVTDPLGTAGVHPQSEELGDGEPATHIARQSGTSVVQNGQNLFQRKSSPRVAFFWRRPSQCHAPGAGVERRAMTTVGAVSSGTCSAREGCSARRHSSVGEQRLHRVRTWRRTTM